jgi:hypothetical protein
MEQSMIESIAKLTDNVKVLTEKLDKQTKKANRLEARLMTWMQSSPASERGAANFSIGSPVASCAKRTIDVDDAEDAPPTKQIKPSSEPVMDAFAALDGLGSADTRTTDINIIAQLELLHSNGVFQAKKRQADAADDVVTKRALFDSNNKYFFGYNPNMAQDRKGGKKHYTNAMTAVAIAFDGNQWNRMFDESLDSNAVRTIMAAVSKEVHLKIKDLSITLQIRKPTDKFRELKNLRSVSGKWKEIIEALSKTRKSETEREEWLMGQLGEVAVAGTQKSLTTCWGSKE